MERAPLLVERGHEPWLVNESGGLTQSEFLYRVHRLADRLPERRYAIILSRGRGNFVAGFCAALMREQTALLPSNDTDTAVAELADRYPDCYVMVDEPRRTLIDSVDTSLSEIESGFAADIPSVAADQVVAILQTSGSTGEPQLHEKTWNTMLAGANRWSNRFGIDSSDYIVATVPSQHMYGFEASVMLPLQTGASVFVGRPVYPADVAVALRLGPGSATLVTTPMHLNICERSNVNWPSIRRVISSTAGLDVPVAVACESCMKTTVTEIFGSTETGAIASRRTVNCETWLCLNGLALDGQETVTKVTDTTTGESIAIEDDLDILDAETFRLNGRSSDMLKIAGKRASLADLTLRLKRIEGVKDGVLIRGLNQGTTGVNRLIALVVAPELSDREIRAELAHQIDSVFLPRRILHVDELPRNTIGKLSHRAAQALAMRLIDQ